MLEQRYSKPDFDPYDDAGLTVDDAPNDGWPAPQAGHPLSATLALPGSKSLTNRELVLAALADAPGRLEAPLRSRDTDLMVEALRSLGVEIRDIPGNGAFGADWMITPAELFGGVSIDCGLAGTVMRFLPPLAALGLGPMVFDGDRQARKRPMSTMINALRALGADLDDAGSGRMPFTVHGTGELMGGKLEIDASASSQFVSGLLLSAPRFRDGLQLRHVGARLPSLPHIEMTISCLAARGVQVDSPEPGVWHVEPQTIRARDVAIEPDLSNAAPFLAAALVVGGTVTISGWPQHTTQVGAHLESLLAAFGAAVRRSHGSFTVDGSVGFCGGKTLPAVELDLSSAGELAPTLVTLAALADGESRITGIGHLRGHETDRLAALVRNLNAVGASAEELEDGIAIRPGNLHAANWAAEADHRMATSGALIGLAIPGVVVDDIATTAKTLPEFVDLWGQLLA